MSHQKSSLPIVLQAIPISKDLKRYFWSKYNWLKTNNGAKYAAATFKELRQVMMSYIDCLDRHEQIEEFVARCPVRKNGWLRKLFAYADTQPLHVLQFLKLYTVESEPVVSAKEAASEMHAELLEAQPVGLPTVLYSWMWVLTHKSEYKQIIFDTWGGAEWDTKNSKLAWVIYSTQAIVSELKEKGCTRKDAIRFCLRYVDKMLRILTPRQYSDSECLYLVQRQLPTMKSYKRWSGDTPTPTDYSESGSISGGDNPFEEDLMSLFSLSEDWYNETLTIMDVLPEELTELASEVNPPEEGREIVGHIRQIPKKGTVVRRSIADPNKFLQAGLEPFRKFLRSMTNKVPRNCQFNQAKMDGEIRFHLNFGYAGSVDLHKATDWLPLSWFNALEEFMLDAWYPRNASSAILDGKQCFENSRLLTSRHLFYRMCGALWDNEGWESRWLRGQPLGTTPSFEILTLTHFCVLEALCWSSGLMSSPYALLGDDVVIFDKNVREKYITLMNAVGSPLSLHKSYSGRMTEFAGKVHVVNQRTQYCSDVPMVSWTNLFDYQRSTGIVISYRDLPKEVKAKLRRYASTYQPGLRPEDLYRAMQLCTDVPAATHMTSVIGDLVKNYYAATKEDPVEGTPRLYGFVYSGRSGLYDHQVVLPTHRRKAKWWTKKVRPESTTSIARRCLLAH